MSLILPYSLRSLFTLPFLYPSTFSPISNTIPNARQAVVHSPKGGRITSTGFTLTLSGKCYYCPGTPAAKLNRAQLHSICKPGAEQDEFLAATALDSKISIEDVEKIYGGDDVWCPDFLDG